MSVNRYRTVKYQESPQIKHLDQLNTYPQEGQWQQVMPLRNRWSSSVYMVRQC